jgi:alanyl-tRNA synthetase
MRTLAKGISYFEEHISDLDSRLISGPFAFTLFDTYGFPIDLTLLMAKEKEFDVDMAGFERSLTEQKNRSRAATTLDTEDWIQLDDEPGNDFVGYDDLVIDTRISKYRKVKTKGKEQFQLVLDKTPFYAESGGQVGDKGVLQADGEIIQVTDTKKENNLIIHFTDKLPSIPDVRLTAKVDLESRLNTAYNHTATHLLHAALRKVLGSHVSQKGSLVSPDVLRFDFSHFSKLSDEEIRQIEMLVNQKIRENIPVEIREMPKEEAMKKGAMALFGEKYGDKVRVVTIDPAYSVELCGGTHVANTGMIGVFAIVSESAVAAGVRRIEALTGAVAMRYITDKINQVRQISELLKTREPLKSVEKLMEEKVALERRLETMEARHLVQVRNSLLEKDEIINGVTFVGDIVEVGNPDALKKLCYELKSKLHDYVAVVAANIGGKPFVAIGISETVTVARNLDAARLVKEVVAPLIKGGGGGQKTLATSGGQDASNLPRVIDAVRSAVESS